MGLTLSLEEGSHQEHRNVLCHNGSGPHRTRGPGFEPGSHLLGGPVGCLPAWGRSWKPVLGVSSWGGDPHMHCSLARAGCLHFSRIKQKTSVP